MVTNPLYGVVAPSGLLNLWNDYIFSEYSRFNNRNMIFLEGKVVSLQLLNVMTTFLLRIYAYIAWHILCQQLYAYLQTDNHGREW